MTIGPRFARFGRILLPTVFDDLKETVGDQLEATGALVLPGDPSPEPFQFTLPLRATKGDTDPLIGGRMRRQVRALMRNQEALAGGIYFTFDQDEEQNGWLRPGQCDITYTEQGGVTFSDYTFELSDCYRIGSPRTLRPARQLELYDRRLSTTARDYLGTLYSVDFASLSALALNFLPVNVSDALGTGNAVITQALRQTIEGTLGVLAGRAHKEIISFEQAEADHGKADVLVLDRKGVLAPGFTLAGDTAPQDTYGWEEIYGQDQPLTAADVPVLQNGLCRVRYDATNTPGFKIDQYQAGVGYVEQGKVLIGIGSVLDNTLVGAATLLEWTPEQAVIRTVMRAAVVGSREEVYITLRRGWTGPRFEIYAGPAASTQLYYTLKDADPNDTAMKIDAAGAGAVQATAGTGSALWPALAQLGASSFTGENEVVILREGVGKSSVMLGVLQAAAGASVGNGTEAYGVARNRVALSAPSGYLSCHIGYAVQLTDQVMEAEAMTLGAGTANTVDAAASAGHAATATRTADAVHVSKAAWPNGQLAKYRVFARVKTSASTLNAYAKTTATTGATKNTTSAAYTWLDLGDVLANNSTLEIHQWATAAATTSLDRVEAFLLEDRTAAPPAYAGGRDLGQSILYDARSVPVLVDR